MGPRSISHSFSTPPKVVITGRFDTTDENTALEPSAGMFLKSAGEVAEAAPDRFTASILSRTSGNDGRVESWKTSAGLTALKLAQRLAGVVSPFSEKAGEFLSNVGAYRGVMEQTQEARSARHSVLGHRAIPRAHYTFENGQSNVTPVRDTATGVEAFGRELADNLKDYPSALHVVHVTGHGLNGDMFGGAPRREMMDQLLAGVKEGGRKADILTAESCLVSHLDNLPALGQVARIAVLPQTAILAGSNSLGGIPKHAVEAESAELLASKLIEESGKEQTIPSLTAFDLGKVDKQLMPSLDRLGRQLVREALEGRDGDIRGALVASAKTSEDHSAVDLGHFLENLSELKLMPSTRKALGEVVDAFTGCRLGHQAQSLDDVDGVSRRVSHSRVSQLRGLSFGVDPEGDTGLPEGWLGFISLTQKKGFSNGNSYRSSLNRAMFEAYRHFQEGEPAVISVSTSRAYSDIKKTFEEQELPLQTDLSQAGLSGALTLMYEGGKTSTERRDPEETLNQIYREPLNYKKLAIEVQEAADTGKAIDLKFSEPGQAARLGQWFDQEIPEELTEFSYEGDGEPVVFKGDDYRLDKIQLIRFDGATDSKDVDATQIDLNEMLAEHQFIAGQRNKS